MLPKLIPKFNFIHLPKYSGGKNLVLCEVVKCHKHQIILYLFYACHSSLFSTLLFVLHCVIKGNEFALILIMWVCAPSPPKIWLLIVTSTFSDYL